MAFVQVTSFPLVNGQTAYTVPFGVTFSTAPAVVLAMVRNYVDATPLLPIDAQPEPATTTDVVINLAAAPDSNNYVMDVIAGDVAAMFAQVDAKRRAVTQLEIMERLPQNGTRFVGVDMSPVPEAVAYEWETIAQAFIKVGSVAPGSPSAAGSAYTLYFDPSTGNLYMRSGTHWWRMGMKANNWAIADAVPNEQYGRHECTPGVKMQTITFPQPYVLDTGDNRLPVVTCTMANLAVGTVFIIHGEIRALSLTGFTFELNTAPDSADYAIHWRATLPALPPA